MNIAKEFEVFDRVHACSWTADIPNWELHEFIYADWPEGIEHYHWLANASVDEIADWVIAGIR